MMTWTTIISLKIFAFVILVLSVIFNSLGIYLLYNSIHMRVEYHSNDWVIANLSLTELVLGIIAIIEESLEISGFNKQSDAVEKTWGMKCGVYISWYLVIYLICFDRLVACNFPLKHRLLSSKRSIQCIVILPWILGTINGVTITVLNTHIIHKFYDKYVWVVVDGIAIFLFIVVYTSVFIQTMKSRRNMMSSGQRMSTVMRNSRRRQQKQFAKIIALILFSFILFETAPTIVYLIVFAINKKGNLLMEQIIQIMYDLALLADPLIYIFLQSRIRGILRRKLCCFPKPITRDQQRHRIGHEDARNSAYVISNKFTEDKPQIFDSSF